MTGLLVTLGAVLALGQDALLIEAEDLLEEGRRAEAAELLAVRVQRHADDPAAHDFYARVLQDLERPDPAAHHLDLALRLLAREGRERSREALSLERRLYALDPLARRRASFEREAVRELAASAERLLREGHHGRALSLLEPALDLGRGEELEDVRELVSRARGPVELLRKAVADDGASEHVEVAGEHYRVVGSLEPDLARHLADVMDAVFESYASVYLDGSARRMKTPRATIRVHPDRASMLAEWKGPEPVEGWWSATEHRVVCYDTRSAGKPLEPMLRLLFHEASHQFMDLVAPRAPGWLDEGTACFFEGTSALADRSVLWPDVPPVRSTDLLESISKDSGPRIADLVGLPATRPLPGAWYPEAWGLVYYLQQFEDPTTLAHAWRPHYRRYRDATARGTLDPIGLFEDVFLAAENPGGFASLDAFDEGWRRWILEEVAPLVGPERGARREERLERYLAAADRAAGERRPPVPEEELLVRALGEARTQSRGPEAPLDVEFLLQEARILERLGRSATAAQRIAEALEEARRGTPLPRDRRETLTRRMEELDGHDGPLARASAKQAALRREARELFRDYGLLEGDWTLRRFDLARTAAAALDDREVLGPAASRLRRKAIEAGLLRGRLVAVGGADWRRRLGPPSSFEHGPGALSLASGELGTALLCADLPIAGDYTVSARIRPAAAPSPSTLLGLVVAGGPGSAWHVVGLGPRHVVVATSPATAGEPGHLLPLRSIPIEPDTERLSAGDAIDVSVLVTSDGRLRVWIGPEGREQAIDVDLGVELGATNHVGILARNGHLTLEEPRVEVHP